MSIGAEGSEGIEGIGAGGTGAGATGAMVGGADENDTGTEGDGAGAFSVCSATRCRSPSGLSTTDSSLVYPGRGR